MQNRKTFSRWGIVGLGLVAALLSGGCDELPIDDGGGFGPPASGKVCYDNSDCVAAECCDDTRQVVHISDAPECGGTTCDPTCPANTIACGCAIPYCNTEGRCVAAATDGAQCS